MLSYDDNIKIYLREMWCVQDYTGSGQDLVAGCYNEEVEKYIDWSIVSFLRSFLVSLKYLWMSKKLLTSELFIHKMGEVDRFFVSKRYMVKAYREMELQFDVSLSSVLGVGQLYILEVLCSGKVTKYSLIKVRWTSEPVWTPCLKKIYR